MRFSSVLLLCLGILASACRNEPQERRYELKGQILGVARNGMEATIKHEEIKGLMEAMTMPYRVRNAKEFEGLVPGDLIAATVVVVSNDAYLVDIKKIGTAPLEEAAPPPSASSGSRPIEPGDSVPAAAFVDQDGQARRLDQFAGSLLLLTFTYTRCPLPTFCPLMDRHFSAIQAALESDQVLRGKIHLITVTIDPETDTPAVLKRHAETLKADPQVWTFLTGSLAEVDRFATQLGMIVMRDTADPLNITHTLRTALIDPAGRLVKVYAGNDWTPTQVLGDLKAIAAESD